MTTYHSRKTVTAPGWPEIATGLIIYLLMLLVMALVFVQMPDEQAAWRGIVGMALNGGAGILALLAAFALRIRNFQAFGFRRTELRWLIISAVIGLAAMGLSVLTEHVYFLFITETNTQADFQAAARDSSMMLLILIFAGAILTPFGEEVLFRGVIANALNRYGAWAGVVGSATIFAVVHGVSVIMVNAFMVGLVAGYLFRRTQSIWPGFVVHVVFNGAWLVVYSWQPLPA